MIGISVDSFNHEDNVRLGRVNGAGRTLGFAELRHLAGKIHDAGIRLKINTVVNAINCGSDFSAEIKSLNPERWKLLRMIHIDGVNDAANELLISEEQFAKFVRRHSEAHPIVENTSDIVNAYIVINPLGKLIDNSGNSYRMSESLIEHSFAEEFQKICFNEEAYQKRY